MRTLLADIASGALAPGGAALREADIAGQFGVSRGVARECVRGLEERGLVSVKPGRGATVNPHEHWALFDPDVVSALLGAEHGAEVLGEYLECRRILEIEAVGLAAQRAGAADLAALSDALARMTTSARRAPFNAAAEDLHDQAEAGFHRDQARWSCGGECLRTATAAARRWRSQPPATPRHADRPADTA